MSSSDLDAFVEEAQQFNQMASQMAAGAPSLDQPGGLEQVRAMVSGALGGADPPTAERRVEGPGGPIALRMFFPPEVRGVYLDIHGGGWCFGSAAMGDAMNAELAEAAQVAVVSVEYRLAPEHPYPAGLHDCEAAALWLLEHARSEFGTERLVIGGGSAGAHLAMLTALRLRDRGLIDRVAGLNLLVGAYDLTGTPSQRNADGPLAGTWSSAKALVGYFAPGRSTDELKDPAISPLYADLTGMPPALFSAAALDALRDDSIFMAALWSAAGNRAELVVYPESPHIFIAFPSKMAAMAKERMAAFVSGLVLAP